jgi:hypothetical protein
MAMTTSNSKKGLKPFYFNWLDEKGLSTGWNSVWAKDPIKAIKAARAKEQLAKDFEYRVRLEDGSIATRVGRFSGLRVNISSIRQITLDELMELERLANMMCS